MNLSLEELLALARSEPTTDDHKKLTDLESFILDSNIIVDWKQNTDAMNVHWAYMKWCIERKKPFLHRIEFGRQFSKRFKNKHAAGRNTYGIDKKQFMLTAEELCLMRNYYKEEAHAQKNKKRREVSRSLKTLQLQNQARIYGSGLPESSE